MPDLTILIAVRSLRRRRLGHLAVKALILATSGIISGCTAPREALVVTNPDPSIKIPAIKASVQSKDMSAVVQMVKDLESDDPAVRFYAIGGLQRLTNETFGYQYFADDGQRAAAVEKWKAWLAGWEAGQHQADKK